MSDSPHLDRLRKAALDTLVEVQAKAAERVKGLVDGTDPESREAWADVTVGAKAALQTVQLTMAAERAKQSNEGAARELGVVVVYGRLADTPQNRLTWEQDAAKLNTARAIEAVAVAKPDPEAA